MVKQIKPAKVAGKSLPTLGRLNMRYVSLVCLTFQTTSIIITYSYSRKIARGGTRYLSSTVVVIAELLKLLFCSLIIYKDSGYNLERFMATINKEILSNLTESLKVLVPASLYALQNNLAFYALTNLDPATYQVAYQLKILTTAVFSVLLVHKKIKRRQWCALFLLFVGVSLVQLPQEGAKGSRPDGQPGEANRLLGLLSVIACCLSSGFSGVYFERLIKINANQSLWIRNFQLASFCLLISVFAMIYQDLPSIMTEGLLQGYSTLTWVVVFLQAFGGLIVAAVVKHADNVLKGFATSASIILSTLLSFQLFDNFSPSTNFYYGATLVIVSTLVYSL